MSVSTFHPQNVLATEVGSLANADGSYTYRAAFENLSVTWVDALGNEHACTAEVIVRIDAPSGTPEVGPGNLFRFNDAGGYDIHITGADWTG